MASSLGKRHSDAEWRRHKLSIERMFFAEDKSIPEIKEYLENIGLTVSKSQLETRLKLWNFRKKVPKSQGPAVWQFVDHRLQKRQQQGKQTDVVIYGMVVDPTKVRKQIMHHPRTTIDKFYQPSPRTPEGMEISLDTPAPLPMQFSWPDGLPWHRFEEDFLHYFSVPGLVGDNNKAAEDLISREEDSALTKLSRFIIPHDTTRPSVTQLAAEIGSFVPENYENENMRRATRLLQGSVDERYAEYVRLTLYKLSNNLLDTNEKAKWDELTMLLETSGIMASPLKLQRMTDSTTDAIDYTANAIAEKLFQETFLQMYDDGTAWDETFEGRIISWLLTSGQNPNIRISIISYDSTPLRWAAAMQSSELILRLLDHGACPDFPYQPVYKGDNVRHFIHGNPQSMHPILAVVHHYNTFGDDRFHVFSRLLETSSNFPMASIIQRMTSVDQSFPELLPELILELVELLVRHGADILYKTTTSIATHWYTRTVNLIDCVASVVCKPPDLHPFFRLLQNAGIESRSQIPKDFDTTSIVLLAAAQGNIDFLEDLRTYGISTITPGSRRISALHVAAHYGHLETCRKLVWEHDAPVDVNVPGYIIPSPLQFASAEGDLDIVRFLVENNADINGDYEVEQGERSNSLRWWPGTNFGHNSVETALINDQSDVAQYLLDNGANAYAAPVSFREALKANNAALVEQLLLSDIKPWSDKDISILEAAIISRNGHIVDKVFARNPDAYDPGALCAKVAFTSTPKDSLTVNRLLSNRPQSEKTLPLEALAVGLAAWSGQTEILKSLLRVFHRPALVVAPYRISETPWDSGGVLPKFSRSRITEGNMPFWHISWHPVVEVSPTSFAVSSRESLSLLLEHGYTPDRLTMREAIARDDLDTLELLVKFPRSPEDVRFQGPLSYAAYHGKYEALRILLQNGEDVNEDNTHIGLRFGRNPLQSAVEKSDLYLIDLLLKSGANVNAPAAKRGGATALQLAAMEGQIGILRTLVDYGADIDAPGAEFFGRTALEGAAEHGRIDVIAYLLSIGAQTTEGHRLQYLRAIKYAQIEGHEVAANLLRYHRDWSTDDNILWARLEALGIEDLENFQVDIEQDDSDQDDSDQDDSDQECSKEKNAQVYGSSSDHMGSDAEVYGSTARKEPSDPRELSYMDFMAQFKTFPEYRGDEM
ncbi:ankyrin [Colletotrichum zoysiae]|uniref:Ankyrin n=1 Tax=Colletotrichum zoysiae TaxID=1216348 RepID=A0AAD9LUW6_9PEZI|nr:ankyrin [Colletotrichum zoysiae]